MVYTLICWSKILMIYEDYDWIAQKIYWFLLQYNLFCYIDCKLANKEQYVLSCLYDDLLYQDKRRLNAWLMKILKNNWDDNLAWRLGL